MIKSNLVTCTKNNVKIGGKIKPHGGQINPPIKIVAKSTVAK